MKFTNVLQAASLGVALSFIAGGDALAQGNKVFGLGQPASVDELPSGQFRDALEALPANARGRALGILKNATVPEQDLEFMRVNPRGDVFFEDPPAPAEAGEDAPAEISGPGSITEANLFTLHSKPGAANILYLDFDGHELRDTVWNGYSGRTVLYMQPMDIYGTSDTRHDPWTFTQAEIDRFADAWRRVADDFAPFDVDVTTEEPPFTTNSLGRIIYGSNVGHILATQQQDDFGYWVYSQGGCGCGGVAYYNGFGNSYLSPGLAFNRGSGSLGMTISHEFGHNLNLNHDGTSTKSYYSGHGSGETGWGPIMGAPFNKNVVQWAQGGYPDANNLAQNDFSIITSQLSARPDDHEDTILASATPLVISGGNQVVGLARVSDPGAVVLENKGVIEDRNDIDLFSMNAGVGWINLSIDPSHYENYEVNGGSNMDIRAILIDSSGSVVQTSDSNDDTDATINYYASVPETYYLEITGVGRSAGADAGYNDYGTLGQYVINGTVPEGVTPTIPPTAPSVVNADPIGDSSIDLSWTDPASTPESNETGYRIYRAFDVAGDTFVYPGDYTLRSTLGQNSEAFSDNNLGNGYYSYVVQAYNGAGADQSPQTDPILIDIPTVAVATSETSVSGSIVSGTFVNTQTSAGSEVLREQHNGGKPQNRRSFLEHIWNVTGVTSGATVILSVDAFASANSEADDFVFAYSVNGGPWTDFGVAQGPQPMEVGLDSDTNGTVRVRVRDSDPNTVGASNLDTITVNHISVTTGDGGSVDLPPAVQITSPEDGTMVALGSSVSLEGTASDYEDGPISGSISWSSSEDGDLGSGSTALAMLTEGEHTITASVTDTGGNTGSDSIVVTVNNPSTSTLMWIGDLDGLGVSAGKGGRWSATVTVKVEDDQVPPQPVVGAIVIGSWSGGANGSGDCTTEAGGVCSFTNNGMKGNVSSVIFTVEDVTGPLTYEGAFNHDPDGESNGTTITVFAP